MKEFGAKPLDGGPWHSFRNPKGGPDIIIKDVITDAMLQQVLHRATGEGYTRAAHPRGGWGRYLKRRHEEGEPDVA